MKLTCTLLTLTLVSFGVAMLGACNRKNESISWTKVHSKYPCESNESLLGTTGSTLHGRLVLSPIFRLDRKVTIYKDYSRNQVTQTIDLPGRFLDFEYAFYSKQYLLFTVEYDNKYFLLIYEEKETKDDYVKIAEVPTDCISFRRSLSVFANPDIEVIALQSNDYKKIQLFSLDGKLLYQYKHQQPFVVIEDNEMNMIFDGNAIIDPIKRKVLVSFDYSKISFSPNSFDFSKRLYYADDGIFNNGYLLMFDKDNKDVNNVVISSLTVMPDVLAIYYEWDTYKNMDKKISNGFIYINNNGIYKYQNSIANLLFDFKNLKYEHESKMDFYHVYTVKNNESIRVVTIRFNHNEAIASRYYIEELEVLHGKLYCMFASPSELFAYTSDGVYLNRNPYYRK